LFAGAQAEESKLSVDRAWGEVDRPVGHGDKSPRNCFLGPFTVLVACC
jgi:hypothetical protein